MAPLAGAPGPAPRRASRTFGQRLVLLLAGCGLALTAPLALAHVKWFSDFDYHTPPLSVAAVITPTFLVLVAVSAVVMALLVMLDQRLDGTGWYRHLHRWLSARQDYSLLVMRGAMAAVLLISWASDAVLAPELTSRFPTLVWLQFVVAVLLLFPRLVGLGGAGVLAIFAASVFEFGLFHILDYLHYLGIGFYLLVSASRHQKLCNAGLPALYGTMGFSLIWLGYEKLFYPSWALYLLDQSPQLALGLPPQFFLQGAAFVEIGLGFLLLIGLLGRPLAAVITLVFFTTTLVFGKIEVIGHTPLHAALVVFLLNGAGTLYRPPIAIHRRLSWRVAFAALNYLLIIALFLGAYSWSAHRQYQDAIATDRSLVHGRAAFDLTDAERVPEFIRFEVVEELPASYDLHVELTDWTFTPEKSGQPTVANEGHGHVFVNGRQVGRLYGPWFHLGELAPGDNRIVVTLNGSDHRDFVVDGQVLAAETTVVVPPS
ncbi:MAG: DoxX family membrane protein [Acidobacteriota bacterium]